jgi:Peptidase A4 family
MVVGLAAAVSLATAGATMTVGAISNASSKPVTQVTTARETALARASLLRYLRASRPLADLAGSNGGLKPSSPNMSAGPNSTVQAASYNWSGYTDESAAGTFTAVSATWQQPATVCSQEQRITAFWVGLDGWNDPTVEQDGTIAYCFEGQPNYFTWWEMFPGDPVTVGTTLRPGDRITASVTVTGGTNYTLSLTDASRPGNGFSTVQTCLPAGTCQNSSAEWITERPAFTIGVAPMAFFFNWNPQNASQVSDGTKGSIASGPNPTQITMVDATSSYALDRISELGRAGDAFSANWLNSY